jgi:acyl dehydratase
MQGRYFDELKVGDKFATTGLTITEDAIIEFGLKYDPQYFHINREASRKSIFGELVASGFQLLALSFRLIYDSGVLEHNLGGNAADEVRWLKTVKGGETISVSGEFVELKPLASRPDRGMVKIKYTVVNQANEPVTTYILTHFFKRQAEGAAKA